MPRPGSGSGLTGITSAGLIKRWGISHPSNFVINNAYKWFDNWGALQHSQNEVGSR
jgi:hypothetical protein